jgi:hypothetical protein
MEIWFGILPFVPRHQLGQLIPQVGDRRFAGIAQFFLHDEVDNKVTLGNISIDLDASGSPKLTLGTWQEYVPGPQAEELPWIDIRQLVLPATDVPMPANIKDFLSLYIEFVFIL